MTLDSRYLSAAIGAIGVLALAAAGYLQITTPEAAQCTVDLADARARLEMLGEVKQACKTALSGGSDANR
jgi:hypothetical protein